MRVSGRDSDAGAAAIEFALVSVLLFTLLFGIVQYGYFFLQSGAAEHTTLEAARAAALGIDDCAEWETLVLDRGGAADVQSATAVVEPVGGAWERGAGIKVSVTWRRTNFGFPFVPFLGDGNQVNEAISRAERVGDVVSGCP